MSKILNNIIGLTGAAAVGYWATGNPLGSAVAMAATGLVLHAKHASSNSSAQFGDTVRGTQVNNKTKRRRRGRVSADQISIGGIPIPRDSEPQHVLVVGSTGAGKSVTCTGIMDVARARHQRAIVYDGTGDYVSYYYRPDRDVILSPIDSRSALWSPWSEGTTAFAYGRLARALIPEGQGENAFWAQAGRAVFRAALASTTDLAALHSLIFAEDQEFLLAVLQASGFAGLAGPPQMLASTRGVCATYIQPLAYLPTPGAVPFSIRDWVRNESTDSWLFIVSREDVREEICPLMSMWIGIAVQSAMSLPPNRERRLWMVLDELPYLQELPSLETLLSGGRKYGLAAILGMQSIAQLRKIYGRDGAVALLSNPATRLTLKVGDSETAEFLSKSLGDRHTIRKVSSESQSAGGSKSTSEQHAIEAAVLPSEIMALPDLTGFLRVPGDPIIKKIRLTRRERTALAESYQDRDLGAPPPVPNVPVAKVNLASAVLDVPDLDGPDLPDL